MPSASRDPASGLARQLAQLEKRLASVEARIAHLEGWRVVDAPPGTFTTTPPVPSRSPMATDVPARQRPADIERMLGGNVLAKAGIAVLVLGVVFFLKHAFDQGWIDRPTRLALGVVGGLALAVAGDLMRSRDRSRFDVYGQVLLGGGAVILYFTTYAAYAFEEYRAITGLTLEADAVLLGLVAVALLAYTTWRRTPVLAAEAILLGTLASFFGQPWPGFAVTYQTLLALACVGAAFWRRWGLVQLAAMGATFIAFVGFLAADLDHWAVIAASGIVLAALTTAAFRDHVWPVAAPSAAAQKAGLLVTAIWTGTAFLGTWLIVSVAYEFLALDPLVFHGPTTAGLGVAALILAFTRAAPVGARWGWGVAGTVLVLSWAPMQFDGAATVYAWSALLLVGAALIHVRNHVLVRAATTVAVALVVGHLMSFDFGELYEGRVDDVMGTFPFAAAFASILAVWLIGMRRERPADVYVRLALAAALVVPIAYFSAILDGYAISIAWAAQALLLVVAGFAGSLRDLRIAALAIFGLVLGRVFLIDLTELDIVVRIITFLAVGTLLLIASFLYARRRQATGPAGPKPAVAVGRRATPRSPRP